MLLSQVSNDTLAQICYYLPTITMGMLFATNNRELMRRLSSPEVRPSLTFPFRINSQIAGYISGNPGIKSFSHIGSDAERRRVNNPPFENCWHSVSRYITSVLSIRFLTYLTPSLTSLEIYTNFAADDTTLESGVTFASLFPNLKRLVLVNMDEQSTPVHYLFVQLISKLPPKLDTLHLLSSKATPKLGQLPRTITNLNATQPTAMAHLAGFPAANPTFTLLKRLHTHLPLLQTLSLYMTTPTADEIRIDEIEPLLPHLSVLNLSGVTGTAEANAVIRSLPTVRSITIAGSNFVYGYDDDQPPEKNEEVLPGSTRRTDAVFPPFLTSLKLVSPYNLTLSKSFFKALPSSLLTLKLESCNVSFIDVSWLSLVTMPLVELELSSMPWQINELPKSLQILKICALSLGSRSVPLSGAAGSTDRLDWPPNITRLDMPGQFVTKAQALTFPPSLTHLACGLVKEENWTQEDILSHFLDRLPSCNIFTQNSVVFITDRASKMVEKDVKAIDGNLTDSSMMDVDDVEMKVYGEKKYHGYDKNLASNGGTLSLMHWARHRIRHLSPRFQASWRFAAPLSSSSEETNSSAPPITPITLPSGVRSVIFPRNVQSSFEHGSLYIWPECVTLFANLPPSSLLEFKADDSEHFDPQSHPFARQYITDELPNLLSNLGQSLTTLSLKHHPICPPFELLPPSLTHLAVGSPEAAKTMNFRSPDFELWKKRYRRQESNTSTSTQPQRRYPGAVFGGEMPPHEVELGSVSDLPRGLKHLSIPQSFIKSDSVHQEWPGLLKILHFSSYGWEDIEIMKLRKEKLPNLEEMTIYGYIVTYGAQHPSLTLDDHQSSSVPSSLSSSISSTPLVTSLENVDMRTLSSIICKPFQENGITLNLIFVPNPLVFATDQTHSINICHPQASAFRLSHRVKDSYDFKFGMINLLAPASVDIHYEDSFDFSTFGRTYRSLTSLSLLGPMISWDAIACLPETLKHLTARVHSMTKLAVDPTIRFPRFLESVQLDCASSFLLTSTGIANLPPNLSILECNSMVISPNLIPDLPLKLDTLFFDANETWSDVDVYALLSRFGNSFKRLSISYCLLTGALLPIADLKQASETFELTTSYLKDATNARLGPHVDILWSAPSSMPFNFYALDCTHPDSLKSLEVIKSSDLMFGAKDLPIRSINLRFASIVNLSDSLPHFALPSKLTSLSVTLQEFTAQAASCLPRSLEHLALQIPAGHQPSWNPALENLAYLPRKLVSFTLDCVNAATSSSDRNPSLASAVLVLTQPILLQSTTVPNSYTRTTMSLHCIMPRILKRLEGLPTEKLRHLSLVPFCLTPSVLADLGSELRLLRCASFEMAHDELPDYISSKFPQLTVETSFENLLQPLDLFAPTTTTRLQLNCPSNTLRADSTIASDILPRPYF